LNLTCCNPYQKQTTIKIDIDKNPATVTPGLDDKKLKVDCFENDPKKDIGKTTDCDKKSTPDKKTGPCDLKVVENINGCMSL
jgi:hypothetical protein